MHRPLLLIGFVLSGTMALRPALRAPLLAQPSTLSLSGTVRGEDSGKPLASVALASGTREAYTNAQGEFVLTGLTPGPNQVRLRRIGYVQLDTIVVLGPGKSHRLDVVLQSGLYAAMRRAEAVAEAESASAGRVDSSALGLLGASATNSGSPFTFSSFGARMLAAIDRGHEADSNTVTSPVSAGLAFSLALLGARGGTASGLATALDMRALSRASLERDGAAFLAATRGRTDVQLDIANAVWVDSAARLTAGFAASAGAWHATVGTLRLLSGAALVTINRWADQSTHGKISSILREPLPDTTMLFLANAVYFKGKWLDPFDRSATRPHDFILASGRRVRVPAMDRTGWMAYHGDRGFQVVRLPYRGGRVAMYVILPDSGTSVSTLEQRFAASGWPASLAERDKRDVHLVLPKLHVEQTRDLMPTLGALGASVALDCRQADFSDMAVSRSNAPIPLCIGKAVQTVYLDVDEEGTEAAAVSGVGIVGPTSLPPPPLEFVVNRPFLFVLRDESTGADLFVGSIRRP